MGLDIYLYKLSKNQIKSLKKLPNTKQATYVEKLAEKDQLQAVDRPSTVFPGHLFRIGYFRSSYNNTGINSFFRQYGLPGLYEIFSINDENYIKIPDWKQVHKNITETINQFQMLRINEELKYHVFREFSRAQTITSAEEVLKIFNQHRKKGTPYKTFSTKEGLFTLDGWKIYGIMRGNSEQEPTSESMLYIIGKNSEETIDWYFQALTIIKETIDLVLSEEAQGEKYVLSWSA